MIGWIVVVIVVALVVVGWAVTRRSRGGSAKSLRSDEAAMQGSRKDQWRDYGPTSV